MLATAVVCSRAYTLVRLTVNTARLNPDVSDDRAAQIEAFCDNQHHGCALQVRLLMSYVITHPEKMDDARQQQWQRLAHLTDMDMNTINNLELLGVPVKKRGNAKSGLGLTFGRKRKRAVRKVTVSPLCRPCCDMQ